MLKITDGLKRTLNLNDIESRKTIELPDFTPDSLIDNYQDPKQIGGMNVGGGILGQKPTPPAQEPRLLTSKQYFENPLISDFKRDPQLRPVMFDIEKKALKKQLNPNTAQKSLTPNFKTYTNPTSGTLLIGGIEFEPRQSRPLNLNDMSVANELSGSALIPYAKDEPSTEFENQQVQIQNLDTKIKDFEFENQGVSRYDRTPAGRKLNEIYENRERLLSETFPNYKSSENKQREIGQTFLTSIAKRVEGNESQYQKLEQMEAALDRLYKISPDLTGPLEATLLPFKSLLVDLGLPEEGFLEGTTAQEAVSAIHNAIVPFMRAESSGPQSDFESRKLVDATMGLSKTPGANRFILKAYKTVREYNKDVAKETYEWNRINRNQYEKNKKGQTYEEYIEEKVPSIFTRLKMPRYKNANEMLEDANNGSVKPGDYYFNEQSQSVKIFGG